jgi:hypothetical protein
MLTSALAERTRAPRPAAAAYPGPDDGRLLAVERLGLLDRELLAKAYVRVTRAADWITPKDEARAPA